MNLKKVVIFTSLLILNINSYAMNKAPNIAPPSLKVNVVIKVNDRQQYHNPTWMEVGAKCKIDTADQNVNLKLELSKGYAIINKKKYKSPTVIEAYAVNDHDKFNIQVGKETKVALTLLEEGNTQPINASCTVIL